MQKEPSLAGYGPGLVCPKCGFEQEEGLECRRCGIIVAKFKPLQADLATPSATVDRKSQSNPFLFLLKLFRAFSWLSLPITAGVLLLILRQSPPLPIQADPQAAERVTEKMAQLQVAMQASQSQTVSLSEAELNQWMSQNLVIASTHQAQQAGVPLPAGHEPTVQEMQSALKDVRMNLVGHQLRAYVLFVLYGKEISLQLDGTIETQEGYIRLKPTAGKLGSLPILSSTLDHVVSQLFDSPQNRDKFQLPPQIESIRVENSALLITTR